MRGALAWNPGSIRSLGSGKAPGKIRLEPPCHDPALLPSQKRGLLEDFAHESVRSLGITAARPLGVPQSQVDPPLTAVALDLVREECPLAPPHPPLEPFVLDLA
jgi:hypothetical protein